MSETSKGYHIKIENLSKSFGDLDVLSNVNLEIEPGSFIAVVGHSGCGKSTLMRLISGLETPTSGSIKLDGQTVNGLAADVRFMFQESRLLPWKKILANVEIGISKSEEALALQSLREVGLEDRKDEWPYVLSGGQKQRVSLARALTCNPKLLMLDEPLGALDALTRIDMQQLIERIWRDKGFTVILVTHDVSEAVALADRVLLIEDHRITMDLSIRLARPRSRNTDFAYYEKKILDKITNRSPASCTDNVDYII